ncbi:MAG: hypothetical protein IKF09_02040, partial [Clostridiales bacterium]|nr:hypothetical protein [Clostridiales bacterium]
HKAIDIDRTVGWFTSLYPVILNNCQDKEETIVNTKDMLRRIPGNGIGYGLLYRNGITGRVDVFFNYLGEMDSVSHQDSKVQLSTGEGASNENRLSGNLSINSAVANGRFNCSVIYNNCSEDLAERFAEEYKTAIEEVVEWCVNQKERHTTASDKMPQSLPALRKRTDATQSNVAGISVSIFMPAHNNMASETSDADIVSALNKCKVNICDRRIIRRYIPSYRQKQYINEAAYCLSGYNVSGVKLEELKQAIERLVLTQSALRSCYSDESGEIVEYEFGNWEVPCLPASKAGTREEVFSYLSSQEFISGKDILPCILIVELSESSYDVYISINHAFWDRFSNEAVTKLIEAYLNGKNPPVPELTFSDYIFRRKSSAMSVNTEAEKNNILTCLDAYSNARETYANEKIGFLLTINKDENTKYDIKWLLSKFCEIGDIKEVNEIPYFTLYHCRDDSSINTIGLYIDGVPGIYNREKDIIEYYDEEIEHLRYNSSDYRFLEEEYIPLMDGEGITVNLQGYSDSLPEATVNAVEIQKDVEGWENLKCWENMTCIVGDSTVFLNMIFHLNNVSDDEFVRRIKKAFHID